jgi:hypothetical protein
MKRLVIFDKTKKRIIGQHEFWNDSWGLNIKDNWLTFDDVTQNAIVINKVIKLYQTFLNHDLDEIIQPNNYDIPAQYEYKYILVKDLPPDPPPQ